MTLSRQNFILRILLLGSLLLSVVAIFVMAFELFQSRLPTTLPNLAGTIAVFCFFLILYLLAIHQKTVLAAYLFCFSYEVIALALVTTLGIQIPQGILLFALTTVTSSILIGTGASIFFTVLTTFFLVALVVISRHGYLIPDLSWSKKAGTLGDVIAYAFTYGILLVTTWLSNREIERSFKNAQDAQVALKQERDQLEVVVKNRTKELRKRQQEEIQQFYSFAYYGKVTAAMLHDLVAPLSTVALVLRRMESKEPSVLIRRALNNAERIEKFIESARSQLYYKRVRGIFSLAEEIEQVIDTFSLRAAEVDVKITSELDRTAKLFGDPIMFFRLVANLVSNSVEACSVARGRRKVSLQLKKGVGEYELIIADTGIGIQKDDLEKLFNPFFTTKNTAMNTGIGLSICKEIIEQEFGGSIFFQTERESGTIVKTIFPLDRNI